MSARPITTKAVEIVNVLVPKREGIGRPLSTGRASG